MGIKAVNHLIISYVLAHSFGFLSCSLTVLVPFLTTFTIPQQAGQIGCNKPLVCFLINTKWSF